MKKAFYIRIQQRGGEQKTLQKNYSYGTFKLLLVRDFLLLI